MRPKNANVRMAASQVKVAVAFGLESALECWTVKTLDRTGRAPWWLQTRCKLGSQLDRFARCRCSAGGAALAGAQAHSAGSFCKLKAAANYNHRAVPTSIKLAPSGPPMGAAADTWSQLAGAPGSERDALQDAGR